MSNTDEFVYYSLCKRCSEPIDNALVGVRHNMCSTCARMTYGVTDAGSSSVTKFRKPADADDSGGIGVNQTSGNQSGGRTTTDDQNEFSGSEGRVGEHDNSYKGNGSKAGPSVHMGDNSEQVSAPVPKKRGRPPTKRGPGGPKLTAACPKCKRAKVRCAHRHIIGDDIGNLIDADLEQDQRSHSPSKKRRTRIHLNVTGPESILEGFTSSEKKTCGSRKRKAAETEDPQYAIFEETPITSASEPAAPKKRRRRMRKDAQPVVEIADSSVSIPDPNIETPAPPSFPADSLEGAALLSRHVILSRELQQKLDDCDTKWVAAIKALKEAREVLGTWVDVWRNGE